MATAADKKRKQRRIDNRAKKAADKGVTPPPPTVTAPGVTGNQRISDYLKSLASGDKAISKGLLAGQGLGDEFFGEGSLGRVEETLSPELQDIMRRRQAGLEGYSAPENVALREQARQELNRGLQTGSHLAQRANLGRGVSGPAQVGLVNPLQQSFAQAEGNMNRDLFVKNIEEKNNRLSAFQDYVAGTRNDLLNRRLINLGQQGKELSGRVGTIFGSGGFAAEQEGRRDATKIAREQIEAFKKYGGGGGGGGMNFSFGGAGTNWFPHDPTYTPTTGANVEAKMAGGITTPTYNSQSLRFGGI